MKILSDLWKNIKTYDAEILTGIGIAGMITGTIFAVKATPKAIKLIEEEQVEKEYDLDFIDKVSISWKCYIPTLIIEGLSVFCLIESGIVNNKRNAALALACSLSETALKEYQDKVVEVFGEKKDEKIRDEIAKDKIQEIPIEENKIILTGKGNTLCLDTLTGQAFKSDIEQIRRAINDANEMLLGEDYITVNNWLDFLGLSYTETVMGDLLGWNVGKGLIDIRFSSQLTPNKEPCLLLVYRTPPYYHYQSRY